MSRVVGRRAGGGAKRFELVNNAVKSEPYESAENPGISKTIVSGKQVFSKQPAAFTKSGRSSKSAAQSGETGKISKVFKRLSDEPKSVPNEPFAHRPANDSDNEKEEKKPRETARVRETAPGKWRRAKVDAPPAKAPHNNHTNSSSQDRDSMSDASSNSSASSQPRMDVQQPMKPAKPQPAPLAQKELPKPSYDPVYEPQATSMTISDRIAMLCGT